MGRTTNRMVPEPEHGPPPHHHRPVHHPPTERLPPHRPPPPHRPIRRWDEPAHGRPPGRFRGWFGARRSKRPVFFRARDSIFFEPLVALAIVVVLIVGSYAYAQNWPPVYVVDSNSMQHGPNDVLGLLNTGDIIFVQKTPTTSITTYVDALHSGSAAAGLSTYGELGDVIVYEPYGNAQATPIIHRAILYLVYDSASGSFSAPSLAGLPCGTADHAVYSYGPPSAPNACQYAGLTQTLNLYHIGWKSVNLSIDLSSPGLGRASGFLTMGDDNCANTPNLKCDSCPPTDCIGNPDQQAGLSPLVEPGWVIGVARGMIPWLGALKLLLSGTSAEVPVQSWEYLGLTIIGIVGAGAAIHLAVGQWRRRSPANRRVREPAADGGEEEASVSRGARRSSRPEPDDEDDEALEVAGEERTRDPDGEQDRETGSDRVSADATERRRGRAPPVRGTKAAPLGGRRGRPVPKVRRSHARSDDR